MNPFSFKPKRNHGNLRHLDRMAQERGPGNVTDLLELQGIGSVVDGIGQAAVLTAPDGRILYVSSAAEQLLGYSGSELTDRPFSSLSQQSSEFHLPDLQASSTTKPTTFDTSLIRKNRTTVPVSVTVSAITGENSNVLGMVCVLADLSLVGGASDEADRLAQDKRLIAEIGQLLSSSRDPVGDFERFAKLVCTLMPVDRVSMFVSATDSRDKQKLMFFSRSANTADARKPSGAGSSYQGAAPETADGDVQVSRPGGSSPEAQHGVKPPDEVVSIYCPLICEPLVSRGATFGFLQLSSTILRPYTERELSLAAQVGVLLSGAAANDILQTEITESVDEMRKREEQFRLFIDQGADALFLHDPIGNVLDVNDRASVLSGRSREALLCSSLSDFLGDGDPSSQRETWEEILKGSVVLKEMLLRTPSGEEVPVEARTGHVELGGRHLLLTLVRDISESKESEEERRRLQEQLFQSQKMEAVGQLAGGIAHDFNNLLSAITSYSQLAQMKLSENDPVIGYMQEIYKASERAANLTKQLLTFSRSQAIEPRVLGLGDLIFDIEKLLRRLISEDIEMVVLPDENEAMVKVDAGQVEQVLINLVVNARDAMPTGGKLYIETKCVEVDATYVESYPEFSPGNYVMLSVSDTGEGIPEEIRSHIFEPFFTTKEKGKGTGLGLSTCYGIVAQNDGHILVDSEEGKGTTFRIYFPEIKQAADKLPLRNDDGYLPLGDETILLVEDEPLVRQVALIILREQGYNVLEATNGVEGLSIAEEQPDLRIDLLFTDLVMPLLGGKALADKLHETHPETKVLFTSGYTDDASTRNMEQQSGRDFLHKPFTPTALAQKVRQILESK